MMGFSTEPVRVAIIDTGAFFRPKIRRLCGNRLKEVRSFVSMESGESGALRHDGEDADGHGTHVTSVLMDVDPFSDVYVAKVFESKHQKQGELPMKDLAVGIARVSTKSYLIY